MDASGLGDHGWAYINLDDWWEMNNSGCPRIKERQEYFNREDVIGPARDATPFGNSPATATVNSTSEYMITRGRLMRVQIWLSG